MSDQKSTNNEEVYNDTVEPIFETVRKIGEEAYKSTNQALKYDQGIEKLPWDLLPLYATEGVLKVLLYGQRKYSICNDCSSKIYNNSRLDGDPPRTTCPKCNSNNISSGAWNWSKGFKWTRLLAAAFRHLVAVAKGEFTDSDSFLPHIDHCLCCLMFLSEHIKLNLGQNDLHYKKEK